MIQISCTDYAEVQQTGMPGDNVAFEGLTMRLAAFATDLRFEDIPDDAITQAKNILRDGLGNQIAASAISEAGCRVYELVSSWGGQPQATVVGHGTKLPAPLAVLCNSTFGHGVELDDAHGSGLIKAGSILVPAAMAGSELTQASGEAALTALVAGYEVAIRLAKAINPAHRKRGFHTTSTVGTIGAAVVMAKLLGCQKEEAASALGLAAMNSAGIQAYLDDPCMAKPLGPGRAGFNGALAAILASRGFTGPRKVLECQEGFFNALTDAVREDDLGGLGARFVILEVGFKPHAACRYAHGAIDAAHVLCSAPQFDVGAIEAIDVFMSELAVRQASVYPCPGLNTAMGSTQFGVALGLLRGSNGLSDYQTGFDDKAVHDLAGKVRLHVEPAFGESGREVVAEVTLKDGTKLRHRQDVPRGEPSNPISADELERKFMTTAGLVIDVAAARTLSQRVMAFENETKAQSILPLTVASSDAGLRKAAHP
jgi:2-methylcitrate dehydratase PrpD